MAIYGTPLTLGGGGGSNDTLPPLLDNFKATRLEAGLVPPVSNAVAFKDIPDGSKIKLVKGSKISGTVTYGTTTDLNHRIVFDSNDWERKQFWLENDDTQMGILDSDIDKWLNSTKASDWWVRSIENRTPPDYANEQGFLYQLGITDELLAQNFNDININATAKAKVGLPWDSTLHAEMPPYTFFSNWGVDVVLHEYVLIAGDSGEYSYAYGSRGVSTKAPPKPSNIIATGYIHPMMEPKPETQVALDADGSYFMFENQAGGIVLSADKMEESRAKDLAGAVWVYNDHLPNNVNDGTKINLTREEIVLPEEGDTDIPPISYTELERPTSTKTWTAPEDGYYKFVGVAAGGYSGVARRTVGASYNVSGGSGGSGGIVASVFKLKRGESVSLTVTGGNVTISYGSETANATCGGHGGNSSSEPDNKAKVGTFGKEGTGTGGNIINMNGKYGSPGERLEGNKATIVRGGETVYEKHISRGGYAQSTRQEGDTSPLDKGTTAYIAVLKGNSPSNKPLNFTTKATKTISMLPSKSKVKLGRYGGKELVWFTCKDKNQKQYLIFSDNQAVQSPFVSMMFDNKEPNNPSIEQKQNGNSRYLYSNIHQWLNSDKPANQWYSPQYTYDAPPDYQNKDGFLKDWTSEEKAVLVNNQWTCRRIASEGGGNDTFNARVVLPSVDDVTEGEPSMGDPDKNLDIFTDNNSRKLPGDRDWFLRDPQNDNTVYVKIVYQYGILYQSLCTDKKVIRPLVAINPDVIVSETTDQDGCYTLQLKPPIPTTVEKQVQWDNTKDFYARQFTYNPKKQYQTMLEGAIAYLPIMPDGQELFKLPSKSKIKLGKWNNTVLKWIVCRDTSDNQVRLILDGSSYNVLGEKQFDAQEPSNSNINRRNFGNNRYIWSNLHQWLNSNKPANQWYTSQHGADAPLNYANQNGFLNQWTEKEIKSLEFANWTVTKSSVDGSGSETFRSRVTLASTTELGLESGTGGGRLDIMNSNGDRDLGSFYWCRTPYPSGAVDVRGVYGGGSLNSYSAYNASGVRPLCKPLSNILVSLEPDNEGCYTIV